MATRRGLGRPTSAEELLEALRALPEVERVHLGRMLADGKTTRAVGALVDQTVFYMARSATYAEVAERLGVSASAVNKAVTAHRRRIKESAD